ncbi:acetyltransferase (GNAT) family protein [Microterricola gilva]|uniref:Acetyltransferase (GNAT) family protein n=1 Tax=Microterricola gilva TaxID=393267 RepID=A0A4Q8ANY7_9MICO|nr:GNAT family N-acetyltransferase [Microterricola gilva]RZU66344.1 acetyltransferase (GNAT) family protein [Microterricola gilva]
MLELRPYRPADRAAVYEICVRTADAGADATGQYSSDDLMPDVYAGPYLEYAPELATLVVDRPDAGQGESAQGESAPERVLGYIIAAADTRDFVRWYGERWLPRFAERYAPAGEPASVSAAERTVIAAGLHPEAPPADELAAFPAHLHINLLPETQGLGLGRTLIATLLAQLRALGVSGVHLGYAPLNSGAAAFYARLGFRPLPSGSEQAPRVGISTAAEL